ncbi:hypothetical protein BDN72DRAFT_736596, partial [Pluteus cervinus]
IFLGFNWLEKHNPSVDWTGKTLEFGRCKCNDGGGGDIRRVGVEVTEGEHLLWVDLALRAVQLDLEEMLDEGPGDKIEPTFEDVVPECYHEFRDVFSKENFDKLPE